MNEEELLLFTPFMTTLRPMLLNILESWQRWYLTKARHDECHIRSNWLWLSCTDKNFLLYTPLLLPFHVLQHQHLGLQLLFEHHHPHSSTHVSRRKREALSFNLLLRCYFPCLPLSACVSLHAQHKSSISKGWWVFNGVQVDQLFLWQNAGLANLHQCAFSLIPTMTVITGAPMKPTGASCECLDDKKVAHLWILGQWRGMRVLEQGCYVVAAAPGC